MNDTDAATDFPDNLHEQTRARLNNAAALEAAGFEKFPYTYSKTHHTAQLHAAHPVSESGEPESDKLEPQQEWPEERVSIAGRVMAKREIDLELVEIK